MAQPHQPGPSWQYSSVSNHQYVIKDEPDPVFTSQDIFVKSEPDLSWSEDHGGGVSGDSGYYSSFNMSLNATFAGLEDDRCDGVAVQEEVLIDSPYQLPQVIVEQDILAETPCRSNQVPLLDTTNMMASQQVECGLVKIERSNQRLVHVQKLVNRNVNSSRIYRRPPPVTIQPKPEGMKHQTIQVQTVNQNVQLAKHRPAARSRKCQLIPRVDEYQPEIVKPSQELLAARRLLEEALITGNIVSQARYARMNRKLDRMRMEMAPRTTVLQSFSQTKEPPLKRARMEDNSNCSRALYQENKRFEGPTFTWKIGINGPHKSFNRLSVKKRSKNKEKRYLYSNLTDSSDDCDENRT